VGEDAPRRLAQRCVEVLQLGIHEGVHPRLGVVDVVPFVPLEDSTMGDAVRARDSFAQWAARTLRVPVFLYGPERTLPRVRRDAWGALLPDLGGSRPHPTAGAVCAGARDVLVAYNVWLGTPDPGPARRIAAAVRSDDVRALGLVTGGVTQVSMNLVNPGNTGPADAFNAVVGLAATEHVQVLRAELVGLLPRAVLRAVPEERWGELDVSEERTIEARLEERGFSR
jgi:glutamate formiminotransferase